MYYVLSYRRYDINSRLMNISAKQWNITAKNIGTDYGSVQRYPWASSYFLSIASQKNASFFSW